MSNTTPNTKQELTELFAEIARSYDEQTVWQVHTKVQQLLTDTVNQVLDDVWRAFDECEDDYQFSVAVERVRSKYNG